MNTNRNIYDPKEDQTRPLFKPQSQAQKNFLMSSADIVIYGGAAGGGKTYSLLYDLLRYISNPNFESVIFRRTTPQIRNPGGLWSESLKLYLHFQGQPKEIDLSWVFPSGARFKMSHIEYEKNIYDWQGAQIPWIGFDELTHFTANMFWYMLSRNRSLCGVKPQIRCTTNPDADSWVKGLIEWWLDENGEYYDMSKFGKDRYFLRYEGSFFWGDSKEEVISKTSHILKQFQSEEVRLEDMIKSITFIPATVFDNHILLKSNPEYLANLLSLNPLEKDRLLKGNWKVKAKAGIMFNANWFEIVDKLPGIDRQVRAWDIAGTVETEKNRDPDWTVGVLFMLGKDGYFYICDVQRIRAEPKKVEELICRTAHTDGRQTSIYFGQDPGQAGKFQIEYFRDLSELRGYVMDDFKVEKNKIIMASPVSALASRRQIKILRCYWNEIFTTELENFPDSSHDDQVDALSYAWRYLSVERKKIDMLSNLSKM